MTVQVQENHFKLIIRTATRTCRFFDRDCINFLNYLKTPKYTHPPTHTSLMAYTFLGFNFLGLKLNFAIILEHQLSALSFFQSNRTTYNGKYF